MIYPDTLVNLPFPLKPCARMAITCRITRCSENELTLLCAFRIISLALDTCLPMLGITMKNTHSLNPVLVSVFQSYPTLARPVVLRDYERFACQQIDYSTIHSLERSKATGGLRAVVSHRVGPVMWVQDYSYSTQADLDAALAIDAALDIELDKLFSR